MVQTLGIHIWYVAGSRLHYIGIRNLTFIVQNEKKVKSSLI